jgi:phage shock protein C
LKTDNAQYLGVEVWIVHLLVIPGFLSSDRFFVRIADTAAYFILNRVPIQRKWQQSIYNKHSVKKEILAGKLIYSTVIKNVNDECEQAEKHIEHMEC